MTEASQESTSRVFLLQKRKSFRQRLTTVLNEAEQAMQVVGSSQDPTTRCEVLLERIVKFSASLDDVDRKLESMFTVEEVEAELERMIDYQDRVTTITCLLKKHIVEQSLRAGSILESRNPGELALPIGERSRTVGDGRHRPQLPKLELLKYNGSQEHWQEFWIRFESLVDSNASLSNNEKMSYLTAVLTGEAAASIKGLQLTGDMYDTAVKMIKERFGKSKHAGTVSFEAVARSSASTLLPQCSRTETSSRHSEGSYEEFRSAGSTSKSFCSLLFPVLQQAVPQDMILSFQRKVHGDEQSLGTTSAEDRYEILLTKLLDFIKMEAECREQLPLATGDSVYDTRRPIQTTLRRPRGSYGRPRGSYGKLLLKDYRPPPLLASKPGNRLPIVTRRSPASFAGMITRC
ncbi:uncharacterized protein LOC135373650 [Ornithodoros turicata]|uniref:uncharacterized protein LOC135373650 n=1 Tax=Ornithodoros turicata TaxID=34597 RepID=UPI003139D2BE